jgi:FkbM family methyltransferase
MKNFGYLFLTSLSKLLFSRKEFIVCVGNTEMYVTPRSWDIMIIKEIWYNLCYFPKFPQDKMHGLNTVVDLGAQNGYFTIWAIKELGANRIIAVEPFPNYLQKNLLKNNLTKEVDVVEKAIYKENTKVTFKHTPFNSGMSRITALNNNPKIEAITFQNFLKENSIKFIDIFKIDIEGSERYLFDDSNIEILQKKVRCIVMESHDSLGYTKEMAVKYLNKAGFDCEVRKIWWLYGVNHIHAINRNI